MRVKKFFSLFLCLVVLMSASACVGRESKEIESSAVAEQSTSALGEQTESRESDTAGATVTPETETETEIGTTDNTDGEKTSESVTEESSEIVTIQIELSPTEQTEINKAQELDFPMEKLGNETVSGKEYMVILDKLVEYASPEKLSSWQTLIPNFRNDTEPLDRFNAMVALYLAANHIGNGWEQVLYAPNSFAFGLDHNWDLPYMNAYLFEGVEMSGFSLDGQIVYLDYAAYNYVLTRKSPISGEFLFSYDEKSNSLRVKDNCTYKEALLSALRLIYSQNPNICMDAPVFSATEQTELDKAAELGFPLENIDDLAITGSEFAELLDRYVELIAPEKLAEWQTMYPLFRSDNGVLTRQTAMAALFLAGNHIGGDYAKLVHEANILVGTTSKEWGDYGYLRLGIFGGYDALGPYDIGTNGLHALDITMASYYYTMGCYSPFNGEFLFSFDKDTNSLLPESVCSYSDALLAIVRAMCAYESELLKAPPANVADSSILTPELLEKSQSNPEVTAEDRPKWTGFALSLGHIGGMDATPENLDLFADEGFNSVRVAAEYQMFFCDKDCTVVNQFGFAKLDELVAAAIERGLHLNLCFYSLPGRSATYDQTTFEGIGDFDLFISAEKQAAVLRLYTAIAERYSGISNFNFSIMPFFEPNNASLSTGLPAPEYTLQDTVDFLGDVVDAIRAVSPDRLIIYEPTAANEPENILEWAPPALDLAKEKGNMLMSYNFAEFPFVYFNLPGEAGANVDDEGHSFYYTDFPVKVYVASQFINEYTPLTVDGCLPTGTAFDIYLASSNRGGELYVTADGVEIFREALESREYSVGYSLSALIRYAQSDKKISFTLPTDTKELKICMAGGDLLWCGMDVFLPDEYARDRWYMASRYDVFLGLEEKFGMQLKHDARIIVSPGYSEESRLTIHEDLSYTTPSLENEATVETIREWCEMMKDFEGNCIIRIERANSSWQANQKYYDAVLSAFSEYGFSWWSNDFFNMTLPAEECNVPGTPSVEYAGFAFFNKELLELMQKYQ